MPGFWTGVHFCHVIAMIGTHGIVAVKQDGATWYSPTEQTRPWDIDEMDNVALA